MKSNLVSQSIKEVLQSLVDDGLVSADKIGSSNCKPGIFFPPQLLTLAKSFGVFPPNAVLW